MDGKVGTRKTTGKSDGEDYCAIDGNSAGVWNGDPSGGLTWPSLGNGIGTDYRGRRGAGRMPTCIKDSYKNELVKDGEY